MTRAWMMAVALAVAADEARSADAPVATYTANYRVEYKGKDAGTADFRERTEQVPAAASTSVAP